jgi:hypothetical protein
LGTPTVVEGRTPLEERSVARHRHLKGGLEAWRHASLTGLDVIYVYLDGFALRVRSGGKVVSVPVLGVVGGPCRRGKQLRVLLFSLVASGQIKLRKIDGWQKIGAVLNQHTAVAAR